MFLEIFNIFGYTKYQSTNYITKYIKSIGKNYS